VGTSQRTAAFLGLIPEVVTEKMDLVCPDPCFLVEVRLIEADEVEIVASKAHDYLAPEQIFQIRAAYDESAKLEVNDIGTEQQQAGVQIKVLEDAKAKERPST
jgi:hypothetical protein